MKTLRFWMVIVMIAAALILLRSRPDTDVNPASESLSRMPRTIGDWAGTDQEIDRQTLEVLGSGDFLSRVYTMPSARSEISLFIAYFPTQRSGATIHSPKHCLPGSGWVFESSSHGHLQARDGKSYNVGEYVIAKGGSRQMVVYWYQSHGRSIASEYLAKCFLVADAVRMHRTDAALVRVITPIEAGADIASARTRVLDFVAELTPQLHRFIPD